MTLVDLEPQFLKLKTLDVDTGAQIVDRLEDADGIWFSCPKCTQDLGTRVGAHSVICWRPRVPQTITPKPGRWEFSGTGMADLTLRAGSSSILLTSGCRAHFYVEAGNIRFA